MLNRHLGLSTVSFALCFAVWGLIGAFGPLFRQLYGLSGTSAALLVAAPVLLGSIARIPLGLLTDRFGGRSVFTILMLVVALAAVIVPNVSTYNGLLAAAFFLGLAGSSFAVGVGYLSGWTPSDRQGSVLGIYGLGTIGQSAAVFFGPILATAIGWQRVFYLAAILVVIWTAVFAVSARDAPRSSTSKSGLSVLLVLLGEKLAWTIGLFYFVTFGGFVAFSVYLPTLLRDEFRLTGPDAGFRTAGFVVLAALMRPIGGWLSDRIGGARVLAGVFLGVVPFALLLAWPAILPFTVGALGCAALLGIGNGGVFKLVPEYFPGRTGAVTGIVGALGGLGGFFPPLLLGFFRDRIGVVWPGFLLLAAVCLIVWRVNDRVFVAHRLIVENQLPPQQTRAAGQIRSGAWATFGTGLLIAAIVVGSRTLQNFDPALVIYTFGVIFATWGVLYHYNVWLQKPPTRIFWQRTWSLLRKTGWSGAGLMMQRSVSHLAVQRFIHKRSALRWWMHQCLFWGCLLAVAITFPLVFGWIYFGSAPGDQMTYITYVFGFPVGSFRIRTVLSWTIFHGLDFAAFLVLTGVALSLWRRMRDQGAQAVQSFAMDFLPLIMLSAISVTGLALTVSTLWLRGSSYEFLSIIHAITVIAALLYLPFGKFFHIFQRPAQIGVKLYQAEGDKDPGAICARCGLRFASQMHLSDLKLVLRELGFNYATEGPAETWQDLCPACKRRSLAAAQLRMKEDTHGGSAS